ncbi:MAG: ABC transporter substrate-binding protein [bacterium]|nr:ABC transporter substrate-binding protein [bacterium]
MKRFGFTLLMCMLVVMCLHGVVTAATIKIGVCLPMNGQFAAYGEMAWEGVQLAHQEQSVVMLAEETTVELVLADTQSDPEQAAKEVAHLIKDEQVTAIIGGLTNAELQAVAPLAEQAHIPLISPWAINPRLTQNQQYIFRVPFIDDFQGLISAQFARDLLLSCSLTQHALNELQGKIEDQILDRLTSLQDQQIVGGERVFKTLVTEIIGDGQPIDPALWAKIWRVTEKLRPQTAAVMVDLAQDYSIGIASGFTKYFAKMGGQIVTKTFYQTGDQDFSPQIAAIAQARPDVLYLPGYAAEVARIAVQLRAAGLTMPLIATDAAQTAKLTELGGQAVEGLYLITHFQVRSGDQKIDKDDRFFQRFHETLEKQPKLKVPPSVSALAWDTYTILLQAIEQAGTVNAESIRGKLHNIRNVPGATGILALNQNVEAVNALWTTMNIRNLVLASTFKRMIQDFEKMFQEAMKKAGVTDIEQLWDELQSLLVAHRKKASRRNVLPDEFMRQLKQSGIELKQSMQMAIRQANSEAPEQIIDAFHNILSARCLDICHGILVLQVQKGTFAYNSHIISIPFCRNEMGRGTDCTAFEILFGLCPSE